MLTLRQIAVLTRYLPDDSALARVTFDEVPWRLEHHLLDDLRMTTLAAAGAKKVEPHPQRPKPGKKKRTPERNRAMNAARARAAERRRAIAAGEIT